MIPRILGWRGNSIIYYRPQNATRCLYIGSALALVLVLPVSGSAWAQLSPGPLSRFHSELEGIKQCSRCHTFGSREVTDRCLACHEAIAAMRAGGPGLHREARFSRCADCHVEHQGVDYDLVYWEGGREAFDHGTTGFSLTGRHATLKCRDCHMPSHIQEPARWRAMGKDLTRTFLGLATACAACHQDPHAGQFRQVCTECHDTQAWKPAARFDHAKTGFPLTGRHASAACDSCHTLQPAARQGGAPRRKYAGVAATQCTSCHRDAHAGALGPNCSSCHVTAGWRQIEGSTFDHDRTRYPLRGRHAGLSCNACHGGDRRRPAFARCVNCHRDDHGVKARGRADLLACADCHTVADYARATFTVARHDSTAFPLRGAHLAVACVACHQPRAGTHAAELLPPHGSCTDCHRDPHGERTQKLAAVTGCTTCHDEGSWRQVAFVHTGVGFDLTGRHAQVACRACHPRGEGRDWILGDTGASRTCATCHADIHDGQLADAEGRTTCDRCHVPADWLAERFDHDRDSRFALRGGHEKVACTGCHEPREPGHALTFKPLPTTCAACHGAKVPAGKETP